MTVLVEGLKMKYGLDFGTTNSAIAIEKDGVGVVLGVDQAAQDPRVVRSMLYMNRREIVYRENIEPVRIKEQIFQPGDLHWEGEFHPLIGESAVQKYMDENKNRGPGIRRIIYTGKWWISTSKGMVPSEPGGDAVQEYYEEVDYGTGRLLQALKTALKSPYYKGTTVFGKYFTLEELISVFVAEVKKAADKISGNESREVVCGRPVHFLDDPEKDKATQDRLEEALKKAGFEKVTFEFEPVAAARQFLASQDFGRATVTFVFDFGGGTLDTAIVKSSPCHSGLDPESSGKILKQVQDDTTVLAADGVYIGGDLLNADILRAKLWSYFGYGSRYTDRQIEVPAHVYQGLNSWYAIPNLNNPTTMNLLNNLKYKNRHSDGIDRLIYLIKSN